MNSSADFYFHKAMKWQEELKQLRRLILDCGLTEELKWGAPCYTFQKSNIVLLHVFKEYCAVLFFKGALLKDDRRMLIRQTENVQAARQVRFTSIGEVAKLEPLLKSYIHEAVEVEKAGLKVKFRKVAEYKMPAEFQAKLEERPALKHAFEALTPGRQRAYILYFSAARQSTTRVSRIEKNMQRMLDGKGLND